MPTHTHDHNCPRVEIGDLDVWQHKCVVLIGVGAGPVGPVLTGPLFRKKLVGVTIITINTCVLSLCVQ